MNRTHGNSSGGPNRKRRRPSSEAGRAGKSAGKSKKGSGAKATTLRIIGGDMRGRTILYHGEAFTRPMKDNIRENLFNILGRAVKGAICYDLFAGTGAMAFESLSRGASSAVLVERNRKAVSCIEKTAESLDVQRRVEVLMGDAFRVARSRLIAPTEDTPWIVFLCPPYIMWQDDVEPLNGVIRQVLDHAPLGSVLVAETEKSFDCAKLPAGNWDFRTYGGTRLGFIEAEARCGLNL